MGANNTRPAHHNICIRRTHHLAVTFGVRAQPCNPLMGEPAWYDRANGALITVPVPPTGHHQPLGNGVAPAGNPRARRWHKLRYVWSSIHQREWGMMSHTRAQFAQRPALAARCDPSMLAIAGHTRAGVAHSVAALPMLYGPTTAAFRIVSPGRRNRARWRCNIVCARGWGGCAVVGWGEGRKSTTCNNTHGLGL